MKHLWHCVFTLIVFKYPSIRRDGPIAGTGQAPTLLSPPALFPPQKSRNIDNLWINLLFIRYVAGRPPLRGTDRALLRGRLLGCTQHFFAIWHHDRFKRPIKAENGNKNTYYALRIFYTLRTKIYWVHAKETIQKIILSSTVFTIYQSKQRNIS